jgi:hypothetical protein
MNRSFPKVALFGLVFIVVCGVSFGQVQVKDVPGWNAARWGMTEEEILAAFKGEAVRLAKPEVYASSVATIAINRIEIGGDSFYVHFLLDFVDKKLQQVTIKPIEVTRSNIKIIYNNLGLMLAEKYGSPTLRNEEENKGSLMWNFPTTTIELDYFEFAPLVDVRNLALIYRPPQKDHEKL